MTTICKDCDHSFDWWLGLSPRCRIFYTNDLYLHVKRNEHVVGTKPEHAFCDRVRDTVEEEDECSKFVPRRSWWRRLFGIGK